MAEADDGGPRRGYDAAVSWNLEHGVSASPLEAWMVEALEVLRPPVADAAAAAALAENPLAGLHRPPLERGDATGALRIAAPYLLDLPDDLQACRLALICGVLVEQGGEVGVVAEPLLRRAHRVFAAVAALLERAGVDDDEADPAALARALDTDPAGLAARGGTYAAMATVTVLARSADARRFARDLPRFAADADRVAPFVANATFVAEALRAAEDLVVDVLHVSQKKGYRVRATGVGNVFHLLTLLQAELVGRPSVGWLQGEAQDPRVTAHARGEADAAPVESIAAQWDYYQWPAWTPTGWRPDALKWMAWGELHPAELMRFEGVPTILCGPPTIKRSWDPSFCGRLHGDWRAHVTVDTVWGADDVDRRLQRIATAE